MLGLIYLLGAVLVFATIVGWNEHVETTPEIPEWDKDDNKISLGTGIFVSLFSWTTILAVLVILVFSGLLYVFTESKQMTKFNKWFMAEKTGSSDET